MSQQIKLKGYTMDGVIGRGGMATVYRAQQQSLQRPVAIKVLKGKLIDNPLVRSLFYQESLLIARLDHPNIIQVYDRGLTPDDRPYFVMQYVRGIALNKIIRREDVSLPRKLNLCLQITKALGYAHKNGIIHRDLKPANVLVDYEGHVRVVDFGIAGFTQSNDTPDTIMGTPGYMAPEQQRSVTETSPATDIYAFGVLLQELFFASRPDQQRPSAGNAIEHSLLQLIEQCTHEQPEQRPESMAALHGQLLVLLQGAHLANNQREQAAKNGVQPDRYELLDTLRDTPRGATYVVRRPSQGQLLVLKKQPSALGARALSAAQQLARHRLTGVVRIHGTSSNADQALIVSDYLAGGSLQECIVGGTDDQRWLILLFEAAEGLSNAHQHGVVHGNLHPDNLLLDEHGHLAISDFGSRRPAKTKNPYLPEQACTPEQADLYALGHLFFHRITGQLALPDQPLVNQRLLKAAPKPLRQALHRLLSNDPSLNYPSAQTLVDELAPEVRPLEAAANADAAQRNKSRPARLRYLLLLLFSVAALAAEYWWLQQSGLL